jgi:hypothetical protein
MKRLATLLIAFLAAATLQAQGVAQGVPYPVIGYSGPSGATFPLQSPGNCTSAAVCYGLGAAGTGMYSAGGTTVAFAVGGSFVGYFWSGGVLVNSNGSAGSPAYANTSGTSGMYFNSGIGFSNSSTSQFYISASSIRISSTPTLGWVNGGADSSSIDTGFGRGGTDGAIRLNPASSTAPTISSGFGTSPSVSAGSSNSLIEVNWGTGGAATSGVVAFHGTWTNAPKCVTTSESGTQAFQSNATTTQLTITASAAPAASSLTVTHCFSF